MQRWRGLQPQTKELESPGDEARGTKAGDFMRWQKPKTRAPHPTGVLLKDFLTGAHPLYRLADVVNWGQFERQLGKCYADELGRPALATRLVVGR